MAQVGGQRVARRPLYALRYLRWERRRAGQRLWQVEHRRAHLGMTPQEARRGEPMTAADVQQRRRVWRDGRAPDHLRQRQPRDGRHAALIILPLGARQPLMKVDRRPALDEALQLTEPVPLEIVEADVGAHVRGIAMPQPALGLAAQSVGSLTLVEVSSARQHPQ
jgi:hypothetical protein